MTARHTALLLALLAPAAASAAAPPAGDRPADLGPPQRLLFEPGPDKGGGFTLAGADARHQLLVTGHYAGGKVRDLTRAVKYEVKPAGVARVDAAGQVIPLKEGKATVRATAGALHAEAAVSVTRLEEDVPVHFASEVVPVFTKFGCNAGGCHGKASGQNGFKLSLLGFEPEEDYEYLVKEGRGRRLFPAAPEHSLLLRKATGQSAHGGGKRLEPDSPFYSVLVRWVKQGAPYGRADDPVVQSIAVEPKDRVLGRGEAQQLRVFAKMSDGTTRDVTRMTQLEVNQPDMAGVSEEGLVSFARLPGRVAVMARFQTHVAVFRATLPLGAPVGKMPAAKTFVDKLVFKQLEELGLPPSAPCDDGTFLRRATIDLAGRLPTVKETEAFLADKDAKKDEKLIDRLLASDDHADYFASKWGAVLRNRRAGAADEMGPTAAFHAWIRKSIQDNTPYDQFARAVLTATGEEVKTPAVVWYRELKEPTAMVEDAAQLFLGQRLGCAKCHHHPFEKWSQDDYYGMTAFFAKVDVKIPAPPKVKLKKGEKPPPPPPASVALKKGSAAATNPRTGKPVKPTGLGGKALELGADDDPREKLVDWMVAKDNPFFARTLVNRYWKHFLGRGLVDPEDDLRVTNPASNPELLDALAKHFVGEKYDLKKLMRVICTSHVYRLSAVPNAHNAGDRQNYSRFLPRRLHAEVLLDAIDDVTLAKTAFKGMPAKTRAVQLPDNLFDSYFLSVFGRPDAASACECERGSDASLAQALHMLNSAEVLGKAGGPRARDLARDKRAAAERLRELYVTALSRAPTKEELEVLTAHLEAKGKDSQAAWEDVVWALINTKEFLYNH